MIPGRATRRQLLRDLGHWTTGCAGMVALPAWSTPQATPFTLNPKEPLRFPQDFGAHPAARTEWWYITGSLQTADQAATPYGFQLTFFRSRVDAAVDSQSRFAARQLIFAHTALTDLSRKQLLHDQRIARQGFRLAGSEEGDTQVKLRDWALKRTGPTTASEYACHIAARDFSLDLNCLQTQAVLLQGEGGFSRKGPKLEQASRYYSHPHLQVQGQLRYRNQTQAVKGQAWLDHEWSESLLDKDAVGWDWVGMNLLDGSALTAFRLRRQDGSTLWTGGSWRQRGQPDRSFANDEVRLIAGRTWASPSTAARYPVEWQIELPGRTYRVRAKLDNQELDSRSSTGSVYWEGLSDLLDADGRMVGSGYLEMTGYVEALPL